MLKPLLKRILPPRLRFLLRNVMGFWESRFYSHPYKAQRAIGDVMPYWRQRIDEVVACPDNAYIPRVSAAGLLRDGFIVMHNGIEIAALGYYGAGAMNMLLENRGVHEPQEERAFAEVLRCLPDDCTMLELGAYWAFYSLWFATAVRRPRCFLIEPSYANLRSGMMNFLRARRTATFEQAYVGANDGTATDGTPVVSVDSFCQRKGITHLNILHSDIQGAEVDMLTGAREMLNHKKVDYVFISTHSDEKHYGCLRFLRSYGYRILASADLRETYSYDGLIVARSSIINAPRAVPISKKTKAHSRNPDTLRPVNEE